MQHRNGPSESVSEVEFLQAHLPLVRSVVERMKASIPTHVETDDLLSVGVVGLISAARAYRPTHGSTFATYATLRIRGAILDELRRMDWMPRRARTKAKALREVIGQLEQTLGRPASEFEVADALGLSAEAYNDLLEEVRPITCIDIDSSVDDASGEEKSLHEVIPDHSQEIARVNLEKKELVEALMARIQTLPEVPRKVLTLYYVEELRLAEIAQVFGLTESRICQIHSQAILSLRSYMKSELNR
jgi:RNA polymerase sigma factor for flagellar operon FliA